MLKKIVSILFLSIYLVSGTELHELFKLPQLISHFLEHKELDKKTTFSDFLVMHYATSDDGDDDKTKDMKLPFKSHGSSENMSTIGFVTFTNFQLTLKPNISENASYTNYSSDFINSTYLSSIWQPPKSC